MGAIHSRRGDKVSWEENRSAADGEEPARWRVRTKPYFEPAEIGMMLRVVEYAPRWVVEPHSHAASEVIYILDGEVSIGKDRFVTGDAVHIEPNTVYGPLVAGPDGVRFVLMFTGAPGMTSAS
ncbi:MAG TPA: cupin domain-containing protein [Candidatus Binataceae bacterium]|nr:cupin domain-containing protein [Candidatus Binataceae bacterium]